MNFSSAKNQKLKSILKIFLLSLFFPLVGFAQDSVHVVPEMPASSGLLHLQRTFVFIDITQNFWLNKPDSVTTKFISGGFNFNFSYEIHLVKNIFSIAPGIAFSNMTVKNNSMIWYDEMSNNPTAFTHLIPYDPSLIKKSKISTDYLDIPIELRFRINPDERGKNFWIDPGFRFGFLISDFWKYHFNNGSGGWQKAKVYQTYNMNDFHYGISLRTGFYKFGVYAFYSLSDLFEKDKGTTLSPFSIGITLTPL
ncbi:MAG: outer membrane beta-barrel protein [Chitinophagales bacterium]